MRYLFGGMNNVTDPRSFATPDGVMLDQVCADNVDISRQFAGRMRQGRTQVSGLTAASHSGWGNGRESYFMVGAALKRMNTDLTATTIKTFTNSARACYAQVNDVVLCSNGLEIGWIDGGAWYDLGTPTHRFKRSISPAQHLAFYRGRIYGALGDVISVTDPYAEVEDARFSKIPVPGGVGMLADVDGGLWFSTDREVVFLSGTQPKDFSYNVRANYPAIPYAYTTDRADRLGLGFSGKAAIFGTTQGLCVGSSDGQLVNLSKDKVNYNYGESGAVCIRERDGNVFAVLSTGADRSAHNPYDAKDIALTTLN